MTILLVDFRAWGTAVFYTLDRLRQASTKCEALSPVCCEEPACDAAANAGEDSAVHLEHDAEPGLAAQHTVISFLRFLKRIDFIHRGDVVALRKVERVLRIPRDPRIPPLDRGALAEQIEGIDGQWADRADHHHDPVWAKPARDSLHCFAVGDGGEDRLRAAHRRQRFGRVLSVAVDVVTRAQLLCQLLFVAAAVDRDRPETLTRRELDSEMPEAADAVNGDDIAGTGASVAKSVKGGDAGA